MSIETPEDKLSIDGRVYLWAQGPTVHDLLSALNLSSKLLRHLEEHHFDDPRFECDEDLHQIMAEYHEALLSAGLMLLFPRGGAA